MKKVYYLREVGPEAYRFPKQVNQAIEVNYLRNKLKSITALQRRGDPVLWFGDACTAVILSPVLIPVIIVAGIVYLIRRAKR